MTRRVISAVSVLLAAIASGCGSPAFVVRLARPDQRLQESELRSLSDQGLFITEKVAIVDVDGLLMNRRQRALLGGGENPVSLFVEKLQAAENDDNVRAVVLRLNSPGGTVAATDIMYHALSDFRRRTKKPIVACMLDVAASGAYYLACGSEGIVAQPTTVTGSIGTMLQTVSFAGTMQKLGIKAEAIKSRDLKDLASPLHDLRPEERKVLQEIITQFYDQFVDVVLTGRAGLERRKLLQLADGRVFTAETAQQAGLIDRIGYPRDAVVWAKELAGLARAKVVIYRRPIGYKPTVYSSAGSGEITSLIDLELPDWLRSQGPQFLYLWQVGTGE